MLTQPCLGATESRRVQGSLGLQWTRQLWDREPEPQLLFEPALKAWFAAKGTGWLSARLVRPLDPYRDLIVPRLALGAKHPWTEWLSVWAAVQLLDVARWSLDGFQSRYLLGLEAVYSPGWGFKISLEAAPFVQGNEYRQSADSRELTGWGFRELLTLRWESGPLEIEIQGLAEQRKAGVWWNDVGLRERVGLRPWDLLLVGVSHENMASTIDESTGRSRSIPAWDARTSRIGAFAEVRL